MGSIVGEYRNAVNTSTGGWAVTDKIFGYMGALTQDYVTIKQATLYPGQAGYYNQQMLAQNGLFGLPVPLGALLLIGGLGVGVYFVYKIVK
jgi:hypothetical protein